MSEVKDSGVGWPIYKRLLSYVKPHLFAFFLSILGFIIFALASVGILASIEYVVDGITASKINSEYRYWLGLALVLLFVVRGIGTFLSNYYMACISTNVVHRLRCDLFKQFIHMPCRFYDSQPDGHLVSSITYNTLQVTDACTSSAKVAIRETLVIIGLLCYLFYTNWKLTMIFFIVAPIIIWIADYAGKRFRRYSKRLQRSMGDVTHTASEVIAGHKVVRIFGGYEYEQDRFLNVSEYNKKQTLKMEATSSISVPLIQVFVSLAMAVLIIVALDPKWSQGMSAGAFAAFISIAGSLAKPIRQLSEISVKIQRGIAAAQNIFQYLDMPAEMDSGSIQKQQVSGSLNFRDVHFSYGKVEQVALKNINLQIKPGETIAFVGRTGSGKTTLASMIPRFYLPTQGEILLDEIPITDYGLENLRNHIALVTQHVVLFNDTIANNIAYGALRSTSKKDIEKAAEAAHVMEFVNAYPDGLDTLVGEDGTLLSGGERQRIAIARALLKNAPVLILDEATSALDAESEQHIQDAMKTVMDGRTTIVIAHRLSTIENADLIVVLDKGEIVEMGTHQQLLALNRIYKKLYSIQFKDEKIEEMG